MIALCKDYILVDCGCCSFENSYSYITVELKIMYCSCFIIAAIKQDITLYKFMSVFHVL